MHEFLWQALVTLLVIINPISVIPIFVSLTQNETAAGRRKVARKTCFIGVVLLLSFAFAGDFLLTSMKISEPAFRITGGLLLLLAAINMVISKGSDDDKSSPSTASEESSHKNDVSVYPLAIPLLVGPGALTTTVILMHQAESISVATQGAFIILLLCVMIITFTCLFVGERIMHIIGTTGTNVLTRVCGIILSAVSIESIIKGVIGIAKMVKALQ